MVYSHGITNKLEPTEHRVDTLLALHQQDSASKTGSFNHSTSVYRKTDNQASSRNAKVTSQYSLLYGTDIVRTSAVQRALPGNWTA
jgi:hypothetical protein